MTHKGIVTSFAIFAALIVPLVVLILSGSAPAAGAGAELVSSPVCHFTKHPNNPVLTTGPNGSWDDASVRSPVVMKEGGTFKMWYRGYDGADGRIGLATSADGANWTKHASNPLIAPGEAWEENGIYPGSVISDTGTYKLWYTGYDGDGVGRIGYATSPDGVVWTKYGGNPVFNVGPSGSWDHEDVRGPSVMMDGSTYHIWYAGSDGMAARIGHATSSDGNSWTRDPANPVLDLGPPGAWDWLDVYSPDVVKVNGAYQLWYSGSTLPSSWGSGYATSTDGSNWKRQRMTIPEGPSGSFDVDSADYVSVLLDGSTYHIWYSGLEGDTYTIGYAGAAVCDLQEVYLPTLMSAGGSCKPYYVDDFSDAGSGWYVDNDAGRSYSYINGQYEIYAKNPSTAWWVTPGAAAADFSAQVTARRLSGSDGSYGIVFGIDQEWRGQYFVIVSGSYYSIFRLQDGNWDAVRDWTHSSHINSGTAWNTLRVTRHGNYITVYVNGHHLGQFYDSHITGLRWIGLAAFSPANSSLKARFDNFSLSSASCGL